MQAYILPVAYLPVLTYLVINTVGLAVLTAYLYSSQKNKWTTPRVTPLSAHCTIIIVMMTNTDKKYRYIAIDRLQPSIRLHYCSPMEKYH